MIIIVHDYMRLSTFKLMVYMPTLFSLNCRCMIPANTEHSHGTGSSRRMHISSSPNEILTWLKTGALLRLHVKSYKRSCIVQTLII